jgi:2-iminoacetate synthase
MVHLPDMEVLESGIMDQVLCATDAYDPNRCTLEDVHCALDATKRTPEHFAALLSPAGFFCLEEMAQKARQETKMRFGNSIYLFTPLYISNYCENRCIYCGFNNCNRIRRARLNADEIEREMQAIAATGLEDILLLTGESPEMSDVQYIGNACNIARRHFKAIGLEVYPMNSKDYSFLRQCGADFVTVFQETYDPKQYSRLHPSGRKRVFPYRFNAQERALRGGIRGVGFAALLGLSDYKKDAYATGMHAYLVQRKYPHAEITFSCPRLRPIVNKHRIKPEDVNEAQLLQVITAYRLFMPHAAITISSRESAHFRDHVVHIAATKISAGVNVGVGRHPEIKKGDEQFEIADERSVDEIYDMLTRQGLQPVMSEYIYV